METQNPWYNANQNEDFGNSEPEAPTVEAKCEDGRTSSKENITTATNWSHCKGMDLEGKGD